MAKPVSESSRKLKQLRARSGLSTRDLGRLVGWSHTRVQYYEDEFKKDFLPQSVVKLFAPHLVGRGTPAITDEEMFALADMVPPTSDAIPRESHPVDVRFVDHPSFRNQSVEMPRDVPLIRSDAVGADWGDFGMGDESGAFMRRPPHLIGRDDIRAIYVQTDKVKQRFPVGELLLLEQMKPLVVGDYAVVELRRPEGALQSPAHLGRVESTTASKITLSQTHPVKTFDIERRRVAKLYRVMTLADILGA